MTRSVGALRRGWPLGLVFGAALLGLGVHGEEPQPKAQPPASGVGAAVARATPSVVRVELLRGEPLPNAPRRRLFRALPARSQASGFVVGERLVLTHASMGLYGDPSYAVTTSQGKRIEARLLRLDRGREVALLEAVEPLGVRPLRKGVSASLRTGSLVLALGDPFGMARDAQATVSLGVLEGRTPIDAVEVSYRGEVLLTDASINPGSEGGPLVDLSGRAVGLLAPLVADRRLASGQALPHGRALTGYAIPIEVALGALAPVAGAVPDLGFRGRSGAAGIEVIAVTEGGLAARAGLRPGDAIVGAEGEPLESGDDLRRCVASNVGGALTLIVVRGGERQEVTLDLSPGGEE